MNKFLIFIALLVGWAILNGCSVTGDILPAATSESGFKNAFYGGKEIKRSDNPEGYEVFRVFNQGANSFVPQSTLLNDAMIRAREFCDQKKGTLRVLTEHRAVGLKAAGNFPRVELTFVCVPLTAGSHESNSAKETQNKRDRYEQLERIGKLRDSGVLTQKEFEMEKKRILEQ